MWQHGVRVGVVDIGWGLFSESWGLKMAPATMVWHAKVKSASRIREVHHWAATHHCFVPEKVPLRCPPTLFHIPCGWDYGGLTRNAWLRANRSVRVPWTICFAPGGQKGNPSECSSLETRIVPQLRTQGTLRAKGRRQGSARSGRR